MGEEVWAEADDGVGGAMSGFTMHLIGGPYCGCTIEHHTVSGLIRIPLPADPLLRSWHHFRRPDSIQAIQEATRIRYATYEILGKCRRSNNGIAEFIE